MIARFSQSFGYEVNIQEELSFSKYERGSVI